MRRTALGTARPQLRRGLIDIWTCLAFALATPQCRAQKTTEDPAPAPRSAPSVAPSSPTHLRVSAAPSDGDVAPIVRDAAVKAAAEKRRLIVYVGAGWCEPCQRFLEAAEHGELDEAFGSVMLLEFDLDRDSGRLQQAGYVSEYIPLFALPEADGTSSGKQIEGGIKGDGAVGFIAPRLRRLLSQ
jgi:hypothetical protein